MMRLKRHFGRIQRQTSAPAEFRRALWHQLSTESDRLYPAAARWSAVRTFAVVAASFVLLFSTGTSVYAYNSPDVAVGHPLYPVKEEIESVEGRLAFSPERYQRYRAKMIARRDAELQWLRNHPARRHRVVSALSKEAGLTPDAWREQMRNPETRAAMLQELELKHPLLYASLHRSFPSFILDE